MSTSDRSTRGQDHESESDGARGREHHNPKPPGKVDPKVARAAALAAAEARLRPSASASASNPDPASASAPAIGSASSSASASASKVVQDKATGPRWEVSEKGDLEKRKEFTRLLYRGVVRDNGYKQASDCIETLIKVAGNILDNPDLGKYRELRAMNGTIKSKIVDVKGGHEYLIALGFRTRTVNFEKQYILEPSFKRLHELKIGHEVLSEVAPEIKARVTTQSSSNTNHSTDEATRRARALAEYEADRDIVKERVKREQFARQAREAKEAEQARAAKYAQDNDDDEEEEEGKGDSGWRPLELGGYEDEGDGLEGMEPLNPEGHQDDEQNDHDDGDGDEDEDEGRGDFRDPHSSRWGRGNRLG